jgi:SAM-dependent methyltransferase
MNMPATARQRFLEDYLKVRHAEGRGSLGADYYLALPDRDLTGKLQDQWAIRATSFHYLERRILPAIEMQHGYSLRVADLGAGNCWLSYRLALRGHHAIAVDLLTDPLDGLEAGRHYLPHASFSRINGEFDDLPFATGSLDLAIYNASIHYSTDYDRTLTEIQRCLRPGGQFLIMDSPVYRSVRDGDRMVHEKRQRFQTTYGLEYVDLGTLQGLDHDLKFSSLTIHRPWYGWQWALRPWKARWQGKRPPSNFWILQGGFAA